MALRPIRSDVICTQSKSLVVTVLGTERVLFLSGYVLSVGMTRKVPLHEVFIASVALHGWSIRGGVLRRRASLPTGTVLAQGNDIMQTLGVPKGPGVGKMMSKQVCTTRQSLFVALERSRCLTSHIRRRASRGAWRF